MSNLGLNEQTALPEVVTFGEADPLGANAIMSISKQENVRVTGLFIFFITFRMNYSFSYPWTLLCVLCAIADNAPRSSDRNEAKKKTLGEQAASLYNVNDRVTAMNRILIASQVLIARTVVMRALSLLSLRWIYHINFFIHLRRLLSS